MKYSNSRPRKHYLQLAKQVRSEHADRSLRQLIESHQQLQLHLRAFLIARHDRVAVAQSAEAAE